MAEDETKLMKSVNETKSSLANWVVKVGDLYKQCDPSIFDFAGTDELPPHSETIGQRRAVQAIQFGLDIESPGFNIFVMGSTGTGRRTTVQRMIGYTFTTLNLLVNQKRFTYPISGGLSFEKIWTALVMVWQNV